MDDKITGLTPVYPSIVQDSLSTYHVLGIFIYISPCNPHDEFVVRFAYHWGSLVAQMVKNLSVRQETWVWTLGQEDPQEKGMTTHFSILARRILGQRRLAGYCSWGHRAGHSWVTFTFASLLHPIVEMNNLRPREVHWLDQDCTTSKL